MEPNGDPLSKLLGKKVKVTRANGTYFFGTLKSFTEHQAEIHDARQNIPIFVPRAMCELAEAW